MEQNQLDRETFTCLICLDLLNNPVTTSCGHSYCKNCIETHWDGENWKRIYSCPQCRERFIPRPVLKKNTMLAALLEQLKKAELQAEDVACDSCTGRKLKAIQSCLDCLASFCEKHLQPHYDSAAFKKHKLVEPSNNLQENICSKNDEVTKMFCRTDQKCVCLICLMDEYKGHNTVSAATEGTERQRELEERRENIQQRIQEDVKPLQQEVEAINRSADKTVEDSEKIFTQLIRLLQKISSDVKQQIRSQQETEVSRVKDLQEKLEQLSHTEDHIQFLFNYPSLPALSKSTYSSSNNNIRPLRRFEDVTAAVSELRDKLHDILRGSWTNILHRLNDVDVLLPGPEPKSRAGFLKYSFEITLDPDTAHTRLLLSEGNRKVTGISQDQSYSRVRDRFTNWWQVLSRESLTGRCYWEVERCGTVDIAVAYKNISRAGSKNECGFGNNEKSWALECSPYSFHFGHNDIWTPILAPVPSRVGVYLDHRAGILSFYSVSETTTLLCRVKTTFTEPLLAGVWVGSTKDSAEFCNL